EQGRAVEGGKRDRVMRGERVRRGEGEPVALLEQGPAGEALRQSLALVEERGVDLALQQRLDERVLAGHLELQLERRDAPRELLQRGGDEAGGDGRRQAQPERRHLALAEAGGVLLRRLGR